MVAAKTDFAAFAVDSKFSSSVRKVCFSVEIQPAGPVEAFAYRGVAAGRVAPARVARPYLEKMKNTRDPGQIGALLVRALNLPGGALRASQHSLTEVGIPKR